MTNTSGRIPIICAISESLFQNVYISCAGVEASGNADSSILADIGLPPKILKANCR